MYLPVDPVLVHFGPLSIHWYGVIMTLAIFLGAMTASRFVTKRGGDGDAIWDLLLWVLVPALIGARLYFVFIQSPRGPNGINQYLADPITILQIWRGGIHIYGALIFGGIALLLYLRMHKLPYGRYLDGIALGLTLGQAIGRLGNFVNQELYGPPTNLPWGLRIDQTRRIPPYDNSELYPDSTRFQPLFLYEMVWDAIGFVLLLWIARRFAKQLRSGDIFLLYLIWVPFGRFFIEFMRTDSWFFPGTPFNTAHILTAAAVICGSVFLFLRHRRVPAVQPAVVSQSNQEQAELPIATQNNREDVETLVRAQNDREEAETLVRAQNDREEAETLVGAQNDREEAETLVRARNDWEKAETLVGVQNDQEKTETLMEAQNSTGTPVDTQDSNEHVEALLKTPDDPQKGVAVSSSVGDRQRNASETNSTGIERP